MKKLLSSRTKYGPVGAVMLGVAFLGVVALSAQESGEPERSGPVRLDFRVQPAIELYYEVRSRAAAGEQLDDEDPITPAVRAAAALERELGSLLLWGPVDGAIEDCRTAADLLAVFERLPETLRRRSAAGALAEVPLRERAVALARAIVQVEERWLERSWPRREAELRTHAARLGGVFGRERGALLYRFVCSKLRMELAGETVPVLLATRVPAPGAVTYRRSGGGGVSIVGIAGLDASTLAEVVLHESLHALDVATAGQDTIFAAMRRALAEAGIGAEDRRSRDAVHALFFFHAAEAVRRFVDPEHVDYGTSAGVYEKLSVRAEPARALWLDHLAGRIDADELVGRIVAGLQ